MDDNSMPGWAHRLYVKQLGIAKRKVGLLKDGRLIFRAGSLRRTRNGKVQRPSANAGVQLSGSKDH